MDLSALMPILKNIMPNNENYNKSYSQQPNYSNTNISALGYPEQLLDDKKTSSTNYSNAENIKINSNLNNENNILQSQNLNPIMQTLLGSLYNQNNKNTLNPLLNLINSFSSKPQKNDANGLFSILNNNTEKTHSTMQKESKSLEKTIKDYKKVEDLDL